MLIASYLQDGIPKCVCFRLREERRNGVQEERRDEWKGVRKDAGKEGWQEEGVSPQSLGVFYFGFISWNDVPRLSVASGKMDVLIEHIVVVN